MQSKISAIVKKQRSWWPASVTKENSETMSSLVSSFFLAEMTDALRENDTPYQGAWEGFVARTVEQKIAYYLQKLYTDENLGIVENIFTEDELTAFVTDILKKEHLFERIQFMIRSPPMEKKCVVRIDPDVLQQTEEDVECEFEEYRRIAIMERGSKPINISSGVNTYARSRLSYEVSREVDIPYELIPPYVNMWLYYENRGYKEHNALGDRKSVLSYRRYVFYRVTQHIKQLKYGFSANPHYKHRVASESCVVDRSAGKLDNVPAESIYESVDNLV